MFEILLEMLSALLLQEYYLLMWSGTVLCATWFPCQDIFLRSILLYQHTVCMYMRVHINSGSGISMPKIWSEKAPGTENNTIFIKYYLRTYDRKYKYRGNQNQNVCTSYVFSTPWYRDKYFCCCNVRIKDRLKRFCLTAY